MMATMNHIRSTYFATTLLVVASLVASCGSGALVEQSDLDLSISSQQSSNIEFSDQAQAAAASWSGFLKSAAYSGQIVVKFDPSKGKVRYNKGVWVDGKGRLVKGLERFPELFPNVVVKRRLEGVSTQLVEKYRRLNAARGVSIPDLNQYFHIDVGDRFLAQSLLAFLYDVSGVAWAHPVPSLSVSVESKSAVSKNVLFPELAAGVSQDYLLAPDVGGLNVIAAWDAGLSGENQSLLDFQPYWNFHHSDIPGQIPLICSEEYHGETGCMVQQKYIDNPKYAQHGVASLGIVAAIDNGAGLTGIAPSTALYTATLNDSFALAMMQLDLALEAQGVDIAGATLMINMAADNDAQGSEDGVAEIPLEAFRSEFEMVEWFVDRGIVVVEGVGNGGYDLDDVANVQSDCSSSGEPCPFLGPESEGGENSGAIMVGASTGPSMQKLPESNCGSRVDVFAWGAGVTTLGYGDHPISNPNDPNQWYTQVFGGTSAATPQIAGVTALLQEHVQNLYAHEYENNKIVYLDSLQMRDLLKQSGTPQSDNECNIGVQPDVGVAMQLLEDGVIVPTIEADNTYCQEGITDKCLEVCFGSSKENDPYAPLNKPAMKGPLNEHAQCGNICAYAPGSEQCADWCKAVDDEDGWASDENADANAPLKSVCEGIFVEPAKPMDVDGDGTADLVAFDRDGTLGRFYVDRSSTNFGNSEHGFGTWDLIVDFQLDAPQSDTNERIFPVVADYNSDGRADLALYNSDTGMWQVKYGEERWLEHELMLSNFDEWDMERDWSALAPDQWELGSRPFPANFNGQTVVRLNDETGAYEVAPMVDMGLVTPSGKWQISSGEAGFAQIDAVDDMYTTLSGEESDFPSWSYLPIVVPEDGKVKAGLVTPTENYFGWNVYAAAVDGTNGSMLDYNVEFSGSQLIGGHFGEYGGASQRNPQADEWLYVGSSGALAASPSSGFGDVHCYPIAADYDGDNIDDRAVLCPNGTWRIAFSTKPGEAPVEISLVPPIDALPGCVYAGGVDLATIEAAFGTLNLPKAPTGPRFATCLAKGQMDPVECLSQ